MIRLGEAGQAAWSKREFWLLLAVAWLAFISIPFALGQIGISWDALNHHIYLGWVADSPRFDRDYLAASYQSYQFPYVYWPVYKLSQSGLSGAQAGAVLASLNLLAVPPVWMMARICIPGEHPFDIGMRWIGVALAFSSPVVLSLFDSTSNDLHAAIPLVWAMAFGMKSVAAEGESAGRRAVLVSGIFAGMSIAFKLSNGPLAVLLPIFWTFSGGGLRQRAVNTMYGCLAMTVAAVVIYAYWGWQLWTHFGNPVYPFYDGLFAPIRTWCGWQG